MLKSFLLKNKFGKLIFLFYLYINKENMKRLFKLEYVGKTYNIEAINYHTALDVLRRTIVGLNYKIVKCDNPMGIFIK